MVFLAPGKASPYTAAVMTKPHSDINKSFLARAPSWLRDYAVLARLDRPAGFMLLFFPCVWGLVLATPASVLPNGVHAVLFFLGAVIMRAAGCAINDVVDRNLDCHVARTRIRPVASGAIPVSHALVFAALLCLLGLALVLQMGRAATITAACSLPLIVLYPFMKRVTWWPQAFLGITFNWGVLCGTAAALGGIGLPALLLYAACFFWTLGYDTIYAFQDREDDAHIGIKSTARLFEEKARKWVGFFYGLFFLLLLLAGASAQTGYGFYIASGAVCVQLLAQLKNWRMDDPASSLAVFKSNIVTGWVVLAALLLGHVTR